VEESSRRSNRVPLCYRVILNPRWKGTCASQSRKSLDIFFPSSRPSDRLYVRGTNRHDCLPLKGIMTVFCLIFHSTSEEEARSRIPILGERKKKEERQGGRKGRSKDRYALHVIGIWDAATEVAFGNSDDVRGDSCLEMSAANSSSLQLGWRVFLRFSSSAEFVVT